MDQDLSAQLHSCSTKAVLPFAGKMHWQNYNHTETFFWESTRKHLLLCLGVLTLSRGLTHMPRQTAWSLQSHTQFSRLPPALASALLSFHFITVPLFLASLCLMRTICKFLQIYVPILSTFISRLYSVSLFFPLGEWPHHTPHSWNRSHLQSQNVFTKATSPVSCRDQTSGAFSGRLWSGAAQLSPLLLCSWALTLFWTVAVPVLSHFCVREVFGGTCVNWFPGSFYSRKHHWERGKWKIVRVKAVPKVVWRICELHKCTDLIIWHLDSCGLQLLWKPVIAAVRFYKNLEITA